MSTTSWTTYANCTGTYNSCPLKITTTTRKTNAIECTYKSNIYNACSSRFTVKKTWGYEDAKSLGMVSMVCPCTKDGSILYKNENDTCYYADGSSVSTTPGTATSTVNDLKCS